MTSKYGVCDGSSPGFAQLGSLAVIVQQDYKTAAYCAEVASAMQKDGYAFGMRSGDTVFAMWNLLSHHVWLPYAMGRHWGPILEQCPKLLAQMEEVSQPEQTICLKMFWQMLLNLVASPALEDSPKLEGDIFSAESFTGTEAVHTGSMHVCQGELLVFYDIEAAATTATNAGDRIAKLCPGAFVIYF
eukprot:scaffold1886_cov97-Cylindrotheca_fusiformis.AAC.3